MDIITLENALMHPGMQFDLRILLIGAGKAGSRLLQVFAGDPSITVAAVIDRNESAAGLADARRLGLETGSDYRDYINDDSLDIIINATGNAALQQKLIAGKPANCVLIARESALLIWTTLDEQEKRRILRNCFRLIEPLDGELPEHEFVIGNSEQMLEVLELVERVAPTNTTALIRGASGTGKELVARLIHRKSTLADKPLITVNCTSFSPSLIESELFGYKKGAFTGANSDRIGLLEKADNGTIFLDEIGDMPIEMQARLLRFLQSGEVRPVGDNVTRRVKVRVIAATNRNLEEAIENGSFRKDLFYRLNAFAVYMPTLRERREDIPLFARHFLRIAAQSTGKTLNRISGTALRAITAYDWPGNIRELKNAIERAAVLSNSNILERRHLPRALQLDPVEIELTNRAAQPLEAGLMALKSQAVNAFELEIISRYLQQTGGNVSQAAELAQVPRRTFQRLMVKHRIAASHFKHA